MASMEEAWSLVREIKGRPLAKFESVQVWATKSFPAEERSRTQSTRRAVWAIRKATGAAGLDLEVDYSKLQIFVGDHFIGKADKHTHVFEFDSE
eukprot:12121762-Heterocapsa_arctica.AAC.1